MQNKTVWLGFIAVIAAGALGCSEAFPSATPGPRATSSVQVFRRVDREPLYIVTVNNPTKHDVIIDCDEGRHRIPAGKRVEVLLTPDDANCDLKNDVEYGSMPPRERRRHGPRMHWSTGS